MPRGRQGRLSKGISSAIGLATEAYAHRQESNQTKVAATAQDGLPPPVAAHDPSSSTPAPPPYNEDHSGSSEESSDNEDEEDWIRDETETQLHPTEPMTRLANSNRSIRSSKPSHVNIHLPRINRLSADCPAQSSFTSADLRTRLAVLCVPMHQSSRNPASTKPGSWTSTKALIAQSTNKAGSTL